MNKWFLMSALLFSSLYALPIGNPMDANLYCTGLFCDGLDNRCCDPCFSWCDAWSFRVGFYGDYVFQRSMQREDGNRADIDDTELFTNAGSITLNICERLDIFATLGTTNLYQDFNPLKFTTPSDELYSRAEIYTETDFSWSIGGRLTIWSCGCFFFGIEGQYFHTEPDINRIIIPDEFRTQPNDVVLEYSEWQMGIGASYFYRVGCSGLAAVPYIGVKWSCARIDFDDFSVDLPNRGGIFSLADLESKKLWGWATGFTMMFCSTIGVTVEGRFGDEKAVHVNGQFRF